MAVFWKYLKRISVPASGKFTASSAAKARAIRDQYSDQRIEAFAEAISELDTIRAASAYVGVSERTGERYMRSLVDQYGWQAR